MALNTSAQQIAAQRRLHVARHRLRGLTQREIAAVLERDGHINDADSKPWSLGTINHDVKMLEAQWESEALDDVKRHKANLLAEVREVRRVAWNEKNLVIVLRGIEHERAILGADAPKKVNIDVLIDREVDRIVQTHPDLAERRHELRERIVDAVVLSEMPA